MAIRLLGMAALLLTAAMVSPAVAAPDSDAPDGDWELEVALYGWITDMKGDATVGDVRVDIAPQLWNDIVRNLDGALMGAFEARYRKRWIVQLDLFGAQLSQELDQGPSEVGFGPRTVESGPLVLDIPRVETTVGPVEVDVTMLLAQSRLALGYRLFDAPLLEALGRDGRGDSRRVALDAFAGLRLWYVETEIDVESPPVEVPGFAIDPSLVAFPRLDLPDVEIPGLTFGGADREVDQSSWWVDPIVGFRGIVDPCDRLRLSLAGNVGGFDIGSASKLAWEASAIAFFALTDRVRLAAGYRAQGLERERSDLDVDLIIHGPLVGLVVGF